MFKNRANQMVALVHIKRAECIKILIFAENLVYN